MADQPVRRIIPQAAKKFKRLAIRLTSRELAAIEKRAEEFDPPTVAAFVRAAIASELQRDADRARAARG